MIRLILLIFLVTIMSTNISCSKKQEKNNRCLKIKAFLDDKHSVSELYSAFENIINSPDILSQTGIPSGRVPISTLKDIANIDFKGVDISEFSTITFDGNEIIDYRSYEPSSIDFVSLNGDARTTVIFTLNDKVKFNGEVFNDLQPYTSYEKKIYFVCKGKNITK